MSELYKTQLKTKKDLPSKLKDLAKNLGLNYK